jgi:hypothetical protein
MHSRFQKSRHASWHARVSVIERPASVPRNRASVVTVPGAVAFKFKAGTVACSPRTAVRSTLRRLELGIEATETTPINKQIEHVVHVIGTRRSGAMGQRAEWYWIESDENG